MNVVDFLFRDTAHLTRNFIAGPREGIPFWHLHKEAHKVAYYLRKKHGQNKIILLGADNSFFFIVAYLAIIKSGNICVPLDPAIEQERYEKIKEITRAKLGFFSRKFKSRIKPGLGSITESLLLSIFRSHPERLYPERRFSGDRIAEIIFTSGSTSEPKGVMITHNNIIANTRSIIRYLKLTEDDTMMVVLPFYYCYGLSLLHTHLKVGGSIVLNNAFIFLASTINDLNKYKCTGFAGVPSHFQILLRKSDLFRKTSFPALRYFTQAGGKLHNVFIEEMIRNFPGINFYVMYGQTEATARLSYLPPDKLPAKIGSIGKGIPGVELRVVNTEGRPVSPGETGEIIARGKNIMVGYYRAPKETSQTIRQGWLHTGDLATVDADGYIYLTARKKEMIKVGGKRISPKEVEEVIVMMQGVVDCTIEAAFDELLGENIKAVIVVNEQGKMLTPENVRLFCSTRLTSYKIPGIIEFRDSMEVNPAGKKTIRSLNPPKQK